MKKIFFISSISMAIFSSSTLYAGSGLFFNVTANGNRLTINTTIPNHTYPNAGIRILTPNFSLANANTECSMSSNGYCLFSVSNTTSKTITLTGSGAVSVRLCLNGKGQLSCQDYNDLTITSFAKFIYVTQYATNDPVSVCSLDNNGSILSCQSAGGGSALIASYPQNIVFNQSGTTAFLAGYTDTPFAYQCTINSTDGTFSSCSSTNITTPSGYTPEYGMMGINPLNTLAYLQDIHSRTLACPIVNNAISETCTDTGASGLSDSQDGFAINKAGTVAYLANYDGWVSVCSVNGSTFSSCINKTGGGSLTFNSPGGLALNPSETILYIGNYGGSNVIGCTTTTNNTSTFDDCFVAVSGLNNAYGIAINALNTTAYITDYNNTVYTCAILNDGKFDNCTSMNFTSPVGLGLTY